MAEGESPEDRLGLPYTVKHTPQVNGRKEEVQMARKRGARLHPNSGAGNIKDDASNDDDIFEFKTTVRSHTVHGASLLALFKRAVRQGKDGKYIIYFSQQNLTATITLQRGKNV